LKRTKYGLYQEPIQLCNTIDEEKWKKAIFWVFDVPSETTKPYEVTLLIYCNQTIFIGKNSIFEGTEDS
jgi:hypothetical protein